MMPRSLTTARRTQLSIAVSRGECLFALYDRSICTIPHIVPHNFLARQRLQPLSVAFIELTTLISFAFHHATTTPIKRATLGIESPEVGNTAHAIFRANQAFRKRPRALRDLLDAADPTRDVAPNTHPNADKADYDDLLEPPAPLSNLPASYRLCTDLYNTREDLENDLHEFAAQASFCVVKVRSSNKLEGFGNTHFVYACQEGAVRASKAFVVSFTDYTGILNYKVTISLCNQFLNITFTIR